MDIDFQFTFLAVRGMEKTIQAAIIASSPEPVPSPELRSRFYAMLEREKSGQAERPPFFERLNLWIAGFWPRRPVAGRRGP